MHSHRRLPLFLFHSLTPFQEVYIVRGEDPSNVVTIPVQNSLTHQILSMWETFKHLKETFVVSDREELATTSVACAETRRRYG